MDHRRLSAYIDGMERINQVNTEQRRLSDGPHPPSLRIPHNHLHYPGEFGGSESCMLKQKNSSLNMLLDSTSSIMRTASSTFHCLIGSARRASYCGQPDPSIELSPNGQSGSLYLLPTGGNSSESSLSNTSYDDQRRTVTIYDGRIPSSPLTPMIPFDLMTPIDAITQTIEDPVESFVQIVLEEPDDRPPIIRPLSSSRRNSSPRHRREHRSNSSPKSPIELQNSLTETHSMPVDIHYQSSETLSSTPDPVEPMDFSFLEPVLRGESAAPPSSTRTHSPTPSDSAAQPQPSSTRTIPRLNILSSKD